LSRKTLKALVAFLFGASLLLTSSISASANPNRVNEKVTICHRTHATTNPYRQITVSMSSIIGNGNSGNGHGGENHNPFNANAGRVFNPGFNYPANQKKWQDIIPPFNYVPANGNPGTFEGLNWTDEGKAIYYGYTLNGTNYAGLCGKMSAKEFADREYAAMLADNPNANTGAKNGFKNDALQDAKDQGAIEDGNLNGKSFTNLPSPAQKPAGAKKPNRLKTLQETLDTANSSAAEKTQAIAGVVWLDIDRDGIQDEAETEFENVEIQLFDPITGLQYEPSLARAQSIGRASTSQFTVYTDADGYFQIDDVPEGDWTVKVVTPSGYTYTYDSTGTNDGSMPGTYVPSGGVGFAWAGLVSDPGSSGGSDPNTDGSSPDLDENGENLANTGSDLSVTNVLTLVGIIAIGSGALLIRRRRS
jgi:hypothetical protein